MDGTDSWFRRLATPKDPGTSAHYGVSKTGEVWQWVKEEDTAWHAGTIDRPTAEIVKERGAKSPNKYSIGIECEGKAEDDPPPALMAALAELVRDIAERHAIPLTRRHIIGHHEIRASKPCPGKINVDVVVKMALAIAKKAPDTDTLAALNNLESHLKASLLEVERIRNTVNA